MDPQQPETYKQSGVNYEAMDPFKVAAQEAAAHTSVNLDRFGYREISDSRGESAYVWDEGEKYEAMVTEGLGTKNLVADEVRKITGKTHYDQVAQDTVAMIVNDLVVVGAEPKVVTAHFSVGDSAWFEDNERIMDLLSGWSNACNMAGATWGGGETPTLKGILQPGVIELSGSAVGDIYPKERLTLGDKLSAGDSIVLVASSGIHANGLTLARSIADKLPEGYATRLSDGTTYGEALLEPTYIYAKLVRQLFEAGVDIHYMANITGHGWRKLMRADKDFTYMVHTIPKPQPVFEFIQQHSGNDDEEMYGNFNMGAGYAIFVPRAQALLVEQIAKEIGHEAWEVGEVVDGPKQVIIKPKGLVFASGSLSLR